MKTILHIDSTRQISEVQEEFNKAFPYLKIEFFNNNGFNRSGFSARQLIPNSARLGDRSKSVVNSNIEVDEKMRVSEFENLFSKMFSLAVQVFRKSGNLWLQTTMTDSWTLEQQNNHGKEISTTKPQEAKAEDADLIRDAD